MAPVLRAVAALLFLAACAQAPAAPTQAELDAAEAGAVALVNDWAAAGTEGRWNDLPQLYADDPGFTWVEQGEIRYIDHAAITAGVNQARDSGLTIRTTVSNVTATALARDAAAVRANVSIVFVEAGEGGFSFRGILTGVAIERDGRWMFLQGHLSSPEEPEAASH